MCFAVFVTWFAACLTLRLTDGLDIALEAIAEAIAPTAIPAAMLDRMGVSFMFFHAPFAVSMAVQTMI